MKPFASCLMGLTLLCLALIAPAVQAQTAVVEVGANLVANQISSLQNTITAIQAVIIVANQALELTALGDILDLAGDLDVLQQLLADAQALVSDLSLLMALFNVSTAPYTSSALVELTNEMRFRIVEAYRMSMRTQTIIATAARTIEHILAIIQHAGEAIGNLTISQTLSESQSKIQQLLVENNVRQGVFERAKSLEAIEPHVITESLRRINERRMANHPRR